MYWNKYLMYISILWIMYIAFKLILIYIKYLIYLIALGAHSLTTQNLLVWISINLKFRIILIRINIFKKIFFSGISSKNVVFIWKKRICTWHDLNYIKKKLIIVCYLRIYWKIQKKLLWYMIKGWKKGDRAIAEYFHKNGIPK